MFEEAIGLAMRGEQRCHLAAQFLVLPGQFGQAGVPLFRGHVGNQFDEDRTGSLGTHNANSSRASSLCATNDAVPSRKMPVHEGGSSRSRARSTRRLALA